MWKDVIIFASTILLYLRPNHSKIRNDKRERTFSEFENNAISVRVNFFFVCERNYGIDSCHAAEIPVDDHQPWGSSDKLSKIRVERGCSEIETPKCIFQVTFSFVVDHCSCHDASQSPTSAFPGKNSISNGYTDIPIHLAIRPQTAVDNRIHFARINCEMVTFNEEAVVCLSHRFIHRQQSSDPFLQINWFIIRIVSFRWNGKSALMIIIMMRAQFSRCRKLLSRLKRVRRVRDGGKKRNFLS